MITQFKKMIIFLCIKSQIIEIYVDSILKGLNIMKEILGFHLNGCPYCANAFRAIDELVAENPAYADIHINWVEDQDAHELFKTHPYEYYPNLWFDLDKQYEAQPGESYDQTKSLIKAVLDKALA